MYNNVSHLDAACNEACMGCLGSGVSRCMLCNEKFYKDEDTCKRKIRQIYKYIEYDPTSFFSDSKSANRCAIKLIPPEG